MDKVNIRNSHYKLPGAIGRLCCTVNHYAESLHGAVATPHGYVMAETTVFKKSGRTNTYMRFIHHGVEHHRSINKLLAKRALVLAARKFAIEIAGDF